MSKKILFGKEKLSLFQSN